MNKILWNQRKPVKTFSSAWYDHTVYEVPFTGEFNSAKMQNALINRFSGPFLSISNVTLARPGVALVEQVYHIGD